MKIMKVSFLLYLLASGLNAAAEDRKIVIRQVPQDCNKIKGYEELFAKNEFKDPYVMVNEQPFKVSQKSLPILFAPLSHAGNYAPFVKFFKDQFVLFKPHQQVPIINWLKSCNEDPVFIYTYLRNFYYAGNPKELSRDEVKEHWIKRYVAEILLRFDEAALRLSPESEIHAQKMQHVDNIIKHFIYRLEQWTAYLDAYAPFPRHILLEEIIYALEQRFINTNIILHGSPLWLLTTETSGRMLGLLSGQLEFNTPKQNEGPLKEISISTSPLIELYPAFQIAALKVIQGLKLELKK